MLSLYEEDFFSEVTFLGFCVLLVYNSLQKAFVTTKEKLQFHQSHYNKLLL